MTRIVLCTIILLTVGLISDPAAEPAAPERSTWSVIFVAHRGGIVPGYPENTLAAFRQAIEHGAHAIEVDLRGTKDGEIVIVHDEIVDRTTNGLGKVADKTLSELK